MKLPRFKQWGVSKRFLLAASAYRKFSRPDLDFSPEAMKAQYEHETFGAVCPPINNGYTYGKWVLDATLKMWQQDIAEGSVAKIELLEGCPGLLRGQVKSWPARPLFVYQRNQL